MSIENVIERLRDLPRDGRGAVTTEYLVVALLVLVTVGAFAGLGVALAGASLRADTVLRSNTP